MLLVPSNVFVAFLVVLAFLAFAHTKAVPAVDRAPGNPGHQGCVDFKFANDGISALGTFFGWIGQVEAANEFCNGGGGTGT